MSSRMKVPGPARIQPPREVKRKAAWRKYRERMALFRLGFLGKKPARPDEAIKVVTT